MADPSTFPKEHLSEPVVYRRISGFAIAGLVLAIAFSLVLAFALLLSLRSKMPLILPIWLLGIPLLAVVFSLLAFWFISRSGGTLGGAKVAQTACWLGIVLGLGYTSYSVATRFAIINQANAFTMNWFKDMEQGKAGPAFLGTRDPVYRLAINAEDESRINSMFATVMPSTPEGGPKGPLDLFRDSDIARILGQGGACRELREPEITPMGVVDWDYKNKNYWVQRTYRIDTVEGTFLAVIMTIGMESQKGEYSGRQWMVNLTDVKVQTVVRTNLGQITQEKVPPASSSFVAGWLEELARHDTESAYLDTREKSERLRLQSKWLVSILPAWITAGTAALDPSGSLMAAVASTVDGELADRFSLPDYDAFRKSAFLTVDNVDTDFTLTKPVIAKAMQEFFGGGSPKLQLLALTPRSGRRFWKLTPEKRLQLPHDVILGLHSPAQGVEPERDYDIHLIVTVELPDNTIDWRILSAELVSAKRRKPPTPR